MQNFLNDQTGTQSKKMTDEMRLIKRATRALMLYLNMSESAAHRYIEKRAIDMQMSKKEIARNILKAYEP